VLRGAYTCHDLSERLCVQAQLPESRGGFNTSVIFIDGGNVFDPYLIADYSRRYGVGIGHVLRNIKVSRAFTSYQLTSLIMEKLPLALKTYGSKVVIVADISRLFQASDMEEKDARRTFNKLSIFLSNLARRENILIVATCLHPGTTRRPPQLETYLVSRADMCIDVPESKLQEHHELTEYG